MNKDVEHERDTRLLELIGRVWIWGVVVKRWSRIGHRENLREMPESGHKKEPTCSKNNLVEVSQKMPYIILNWKRGPKGPLIQENLLRTWSLFN